MISNKYFKITQSKYNCYTEKYGNMVALKIWRKKINSLYSFIFCSHYYINLRYPFLFLVHWIEVCIKIIKYEHVINCKVRQLVELCYLSQKQIIIMVAKLIGCLITACFILHPQVKIFNERWMQRYFRRIQISHYIYFSSVSLNYFKNINK